MNGYASVPLLGTARAATEESYFLAEGPFWDPLRERLLWVDILAGAVHQGRVEECGVILPDRRFDFPDTAGAVAVSVRGDLVVAGTHRLHFLTPDGDLTTGPPLVSGAERRLNDGKPDPTGRFVVGTKGVGDELLLRVDSGSGETTVLDDDLTLSNGLAWSSDGQKLFSVDTMTRRIFVREYDDARTTLRARTVFLTLEGGYPDGITIDDEDHLWVAIWGEGCVLRISPSADIVGRVDVPAPHTSCPIFAGPDLDTLVITTAIEGLSDAQRHQHPLSGRLFSIRTAHRGNPPNLWAGTPRSEPTSEGTV